MLQMQILFTIREFIFEKRDIRMELRSKFSRVTIPPVMDTRLKR